MNQNINSRLEMKFFHEKYGYGTIKYITDDKYEIVFDKLSETKIVLENFIKHA